MIKIQGEEGLERGSSDMIPYSFPQIIIFLDNRLSIFFFTTFILLKLLLVTDHRSTLCYIGEYIFSFFLVCRSHQQSLTHSLATHRISNQDMTFTSKLIKIKEEEEEITDKGTRDLWRHPLTRSTAPGQHVGQTDTSHRQDLEPNLQPAIVWIVGDTAHDNADKELQLCRLLTLLPWSHLYHESGTGCSTDLTLLAHWVNIPLKQLNTR